MTFSISRSSTAFSASADNFALGVLGARILQRGRTQQAADMVGAERRRVALGHGRYAPYSAVMPAKAGIQ